jgi:hypothetical protein
LIFFGGMGMASAKPEAGKSFHGVLHKCTAKEMEVLDKIESIYGRIPSKAKLYDGNMIDCTVYSDPDGKIDDIVKKGNSKPPSERYIQIMSEGAAFYGVKPEYV